VGTLVTFGTVPGATVRATEIEDLGIDGMAARVDAGGETVRIRVPLLGRGNLQNVLAGIAVARLFDVPLDGVAERAALLRPAAHRGEVIRLAGRVTVVDDAYNSNPRALEGALAVVAGERRFTRRAAVLGEMRELGEPSVALHEACGRTAAGSGLSLLVTVGGTPARAMGRAAVEAGMPGAQVWHAATSVEAAEIVAREVRAGDLVLVKGSRGVETERVVERLVAALPVSRGSFGVSPKPGRAKAEDPRT
jgi:UDP-N-acetylmuramoyl-tripeptide--D-alanyl-D-alanine ligase